MGTRDNRPPTRRRDAEGGYVLLVVSVFSFVVLIGSAAVVSTTSSETRLSHHQHDSESAFFLADSAIERARARLMQDRSWRDGWTDITFGDGTYSLSIADTTIQGLTNDVVRMSASGNVNQAQRRLEMVAEIPPSGLGLALLVGGDCICLGRVCVTGQAHVNDFAWFGFFNRLFDCGTLTEGFDITPPPIFTAPAQFPDDTYYYVRGNMIGGVPQARIYDRYGTDITTALGDSPVGVTAYNPFTDNFVYTFDDDAKIAQYFDHTSGVFRKIAGDVSVVVNFGETPVIDPPGDDGESTVYLYSPTGMSIASTIINSRFEGVTTSQQTNPGYWKGGLTLVYNVKMEPHNGIGVVAEMMFAGNNAELGTTAYPALTYLTGNWNISFNLFGWNDFLATGSFITLGDFYDIGRLYFTYDSGFMARIPDAILQQWPGRVSGTLKVISWNELSGN